MHGAGSIKNIFLDLRGFPMEKVVLRAIGHFLSEIVYVMLLSRAKFINLPQLIK